MLKQYRWILANRGRSGLVWALVAGLLLSLVWSPCGPVLPLTHSAALCSCCDHSQGPCDCDADSSCALLPLPDVGLLSGLVWNAPVSAAALLVCAPELVSGSPPTPFVARHAHAEHLPRPPELGLELLDLPPPASPILS